ncbi:hypothetical protein ACF0H5_011139 [Mactra antiquata]
MTTFCFFQIALVGSLVTLCLGTCTFPSPIRGTWLSSESEKGALEFSDSYFTGYPVAAFPTNNFTCLLNSGTQYVVQSETFRRFGLNFYAYLCLDIREVTTVLSRDLFIYYKPSDKQVDANNERVVFRLAAFAPPALSDICTVTNYSSTFRYSVLMKNNTIDSVKSECPIPFLGDFSYTYDTGSGNLCNDSLVKVCQDDKDTMNWDYSSCSQIQAYSAGGVTNCIYYSEVGSLYTIHVYNRDTTVDDSTTYRFTCYQATGYDTVQATQHPGDCPETMNETYVASPGGSLVLTSNAYPTPIEEESSSTTLSAGIIAAIVVVCLLIVIAIIVGLIIYFYMKRKKRKQAEWEAANRKVDPDALSPNMRLGLPDETRYDLDRLMYSPENMKNGLIKRSPRKDMIGLEGLELEAHMFAEKRKRKDKKDEFDAAKPTNKIFAQRIKDLATGRKRPFKVAALAKLRLKPPRARPLARTPDSQGTQTKDIVIQVEEADGPAADNKRKTRFADEESAKNAQGKGKDTQETKKAKKLEDVETLSDIVDNENAVDGLSDDEKEPRLILPNLKSEKKNRKKRQKDRYSQEESQPTRDMPRNTRFMPPKSRQKYEEYTEPMPLTRNNMNSAMTPLQRIHRKDNPRAWRDAFGDNGNGMESVDLDTLKKRLPENRWKKLLEELYKDKKYFDYVKRRYIVESTSNSEKDLMSSAQQSLHYLYGRALFWEQQEPIPTRPPSHVKRMYSRYERPKSSGKSIQRSSTMLSRSGHGRVPRTPSTQVSRLKRRETASKTKRKTTPKPEALPLPEFFEGGTQTDFSPIPLTPVMVEDTLDATGRLSLPTSEAGIETPVIPFTKELTKSDIKLEEYDNGMYDQDDPNFMVQPYEMEELEEEDEELSELKV